MIRKIFVSYSWTSPKHEDWVMGLAERLVSNGVDVVIDKWDLKEGNDIYHFMEGMVKSPEISKVLIILDKRYAESADARTGGVGTETQIISPKIYKDVSQEKFLPIITEKDESGQPFLPTYLQGLFYFDFSSEEQFESSYDRLLRNILERPSYTKPKLGTPPTYLFTESPSSHKSSILLRAFDSQYNLRPNRLNSLIRDFLEAIFLDLQEYQMEIKTNDRHEVGRMIVENIHQYTSLRNDFISFFDKITRLEDTFDIDILIKFLEKLPLLTAPQNGNGSWHDYEFDNYRFMIHELFLYLILVGIKNENFRFVEELLSSSYFVQDRYAQKAGAYSYGSFYYHFVSIDHYYEKSNGKRFHSAIADLMIKRIPEGLSKRELVQADLLCHYIGNLKNVFWFPLTYVYDTSGNLEIFGRLSSMRYFEKVKILFGVKAVDEFKERLATLKANDMNPDRIRHSGAFDSVRPLYAIIDIEGIGSVR